MRNDAYDVVVAGGGLAGLTAALHLHQRNADLRIAVVEARPHPVPEAAHKVGESSVEIGAHYFAHTLGLADHIESEQLPKLGLRYFFGAHDHADLGARCEMGGNDFLPARSYQLDRGRLENELGRRVAASGITFLDGRRVTGIAIGAGDDEHRITLDDGRALSARWLLDGSGRRGLLKRQLGLARDTSHHAGSVWFRIAARLKVDTWCADEAWQARNRYQGNRWLSTVHLMGAGYWVWFIPLASGSTSVGIVAAHDHHDFESIRDFDAALAWLERHEPLAAQAVAAQRDRLQDFAGYRSYSLDCERVIGDRWVLLGEAGLFLDPFYSPGSDFIAIVNSMAVDLICRDRAGEPGVAGRGAFLDRILRSLFDNHLALYRGQYGLFANAKVMAAKIVWDFAYYWAVPAALFFHGQIANPTAYARSRESLEAVARLGAEVQELFRRWHQADPEPYAGTYVDVPEMPLMAEANARLLDDLDERATIHRLREDAHMLREIAAELRDHIRATLPSVRCEDLPHLTACEPGPAARLAPLWAGLSPAAGLA